MRKTFSSITTTEAVVQPAKGEITLLLAKRATANEAMALLPAIQPGSVKPRIRKLLEIQARPGS